MIGKGIPLEKSGTDELERCLVAFLAVGLLFMATCGQTWMHNREFMKTV